MSRRLGTAVILENDANAAALGEKWIGAGRGVDDLVLLTLGTGVGGGIVSDGKVLRGCLGMAGELGHITVVPNGNPCGCGNRGCVEKHASATAVTAMAKLLGLGDGLTAKQVYDLAIGGSEKAKTIFVSMGEALGIALAMLVNTFNFPLYLLERRGARGLGFVRPSDAARRRGGGRSLFATRKRGSKRRGSETRRGFSARLICLGRTSKLPTSLYVLR